MAKKVYKNKKELEEGAYGKALAAPKDMVRPIFLPLKEEKYDKSSVFYEDEKMLVLYAPIGDSEKLTNALSHEPCEAEIFLEKLLGRSSDSTMVISFDTSSNNY